MKIIIYLLMLLLIPFVIESYAENRLDYAEAKLEWSEYNFGIINGTGTAKIILTDFDVPNIPTYIDRVTVFVYSDSFPEGIDLTLYETEKNSGVFERIFSLSDTRSAPSVLYAREGDTAIVEYRDDTLPSDHAFSEIHLRETTLIGLLGYPTERLPVTNPRIVDLDENRLDFPILGEQILLQSDIASQQDTPQKFIWLAQTVDSQKRVQSLSWINGTINPQSSFSPSTSWIPQSAGEYRTTFFVWESIDNPTALSPPVEMEFVILTEKSVPVSKNKKLQEHYEIEILGLKDKYSVGEKYSFYFVISGYGYACANYDVKYPDENGNTITMGAEVLCAAEQHMTEFEINDSERKGTVGNTAIQNLGTYTVTVTFERPNQYFPTSASKTFEVVE